MSLAATGTGVIHVIPFWSGPALLAAGSSEGSLMSRDLDVRIAQGPPGPGAGQALRWVCTRNPFYVLSAGLFLAGLWVSFGAQLDEEETWALMLGLAGYTLLLAVT